MKQVILIVDDDSINLTIAKGILSEKYKVIAVNSGRLALEFLKRITPQLVLLDVQMPDMSGFELMDNIKQNREWANIPVMFLTADHTTETEVKCFEKGAVDYITKPFKKEIMLTRIRRTLELEIYRQGLQVAVQEQINKVMEIQYQVIISMANLIESKDGNTGEHVKRTSNYVSLIVDELKTKANYSKVLTDSYVANLLKAAPMHDIGKIAIPDNILQKPGKLTPTEFEIMKKHSPEGGKIIKKIMQNIEKEDYINVAYDVATYHHEKWNGTGYPEGLSGKEIPLAARIMAVADVFDALTSERCYKRAMSFDDAFKIIEESSGTHFDPDIASAFLEIKEKIISNYN